MAYNDVTCSKVESGYTISREGHYGSTTFFLLKDKEEVKEVVRDLLDLLRHGTVRQK